MSISLPNPAHPGEILREDVLPHFGLTQGGAAEVLRISRKQLTLILNGHAAVTAELAAKVEAAFGVDAALLLTMQANYALAAVRRDPELISGIVRQKAAA